MCLATIWFFLHLFCLFVYLFEQSATYFHGLDGTINISKQILDTFSFYLLVYVASAHCPASGIHFSVVLHVNTKKMFCRHFSLILYANDCKNENSFLFYHSGYVNIFWVVTFFFILTTQKSFSFPFTFSAMRFSFERTMSTGLQIMSMAMQKTIQHTFNIC